MKIEHIVTEGEVVAFPKKHRGDITDMHSCPKCGGDTQGGKYQGHEVQVCMPCKQVYLPPNSGIDQQGNKIENEDISRRGLLKGAGAAALSGAVGNADAVAMRMQGSSKSEKEKAAADKAREEEEKRKYQEIVQKYVKIISSGQPLPPKMQHSYDTMKDFRKDVDTALANIPGQPGRVDYEQRKNYHLMQKESVDQQGSKIKEGFSDMMAKERKKRLAAAEKKKQERRANTGDPAPQHYRDELAQAAKKYKKGVAEGWGPDTTRLEQDVRDALENGDDYTAKQYARMASTPEAKKYLLNIIKQAMYIDDLGGETNWKGVAEGLNFNDKKGKWEWDDGTYVDPDELTTAQKQRIQQWKADNPGKRPSRASVPDTREPARGFGGRVFEAEQERKRNALWAQITSYEKRAKETKNDVKKQHLLKMADELRGKLAPTTEERLAESLTQLATIIKESK